MSQTPSVVPPWCIARTAHPTRPFAKLEMLTAAAVVPIQDFPQVEMVLTYPLDREDGMRRREFIAGLGGAAAWPVVGRAQQPMMPLVGYLHSGSAELDVAFVAAFREGLSKAGFVERQNVTIDFRWAAGQEDRLPELAADLVQRRVAVIATPASVPAALAAKAATTTIPIVFAVGSDPLALGLVKSLNRPGGNAITCGAQIRRGGSRPSYDPHTARKNYR